MCLGVWGGGGVGSGGVEGGGGGEGRVGVRRVGLARRRGGGVGRWYVIDDLPIDLQFTTSDFFKACNHPQQRGFTTARRPENREKRALRDVEVDMIECAKIIKIFGQIAAFKVGCLGH